MAPKKQNLLVNFKLYVHFKGLFLTQEEMEWYTLWCFDSKNENKMTKQREMKCKKKQIAILFIFLFQIET